MATATGPNLFTRCNVSDDIIKRFGTIKKDNVPPSPSLVSPTSKTAALERLLLRVPLTDDVASFSDDNDSSSLTRNLPLYSDHTDVSVCLPSSGYKSAPEGGKYQIRTNSKAKKIPLHNDLQRRNSLRASTVTDRVSLFREKLSKSNTGAKSPLATTVNDTVKTTTDNVATINTATTTTTTTTTTPTNNNKNKETPKSTLKSNPVGSMNKWNNTCANKITITPKPAVTKPNTGVLPLTTKISGKSRTNSFSKIHDSWELRKSDDSKQDSSRSNSRSVSDNDDDVDQPRYRRECRRLKREAYLKAHLCDKSDSETEPEDGQLTKAGLERLERRNKFAALRGRRGRIDKTAGTQDENNNETSSDKTLDSGVFDLYLNHYTEDINKLSKRYDSKEFLLDDTLSLKSGYSSASDSLADSIADSVTTIYDSNDEHQQWDVNKNRVGHKNKTKSIISNMNKFAVTNATTNTNKLTKTNLTNISTSCTSNNASQQHSNVGNTNDGKSLLETQPRLARIQITPHANDRTRTRNSKTINTETKGENKLTPACRQVKTSANSLHKLPFDIQLTTKNIKECLLISNTSAINLKTSNEAEKTIELDHSNDNNTTTKQNSTIVISTAKYQDDINNINKTKAEKHKSIVKPNEYVNIVCADNINTTSQLALITGLCDDNDGTNRAEKQRSMPHLRIYSENKNNEDGEFKAKQLSILKTIPPHLTRKASRKQDSTELSLLPTRKTEPFKLEKSIRALADDKTILVETLNKAIQCVLLTDDDLITVEAIPEKSVIISEPILQTDKIDVLGQELLDEIQFKYPADFTLPEDLERNKKLDEEEEIVASDQLKMDNARLQKLLFEVERARSGTIKALLHVNSLLNKVQGDNAKLKSDIEISVKEKEVLKEHLKEMKDQARPVNAKINSSSTAGERWKRDKIELMSQLDKSRTKAEDAERELLKLRVQHKKVKEQLEHSNNAFTTCLRNNLDATKRLETELQGSLEEKEVLLLRCNEGNRLKIELEALREEVEEIKYSHEELQDEKDQLEEKIRHLEKKRRILLDEEEELQEQISHSQEIIEKLSDAGDALKDRLEREVKEKEYLQECLEETGQILYQLKMNERKLLEDKHVLQYELETEAEEKESLQTTLSKTKTEHQDLIDRLQNMTNIHLTVKESLQLANKKEKNYQEQIEALTKTNHILHYTLEKEKEERTDLQEMLDIIDLNYKQMKNQTIGKERDNEKEIEKITDEKQQLTIINESLQKKCDELKGNMKREDEQKQLLEERLSELEKLKEEMENSLNKTLVQQIENEKNMKNSLKVRHDLEEHLGIEREKVTRLTQSLEQTKQMLQQVDLELIEARKKLEKFKGNQTNLEQKTKESKSRLKELENTIQELTEVRDKYYNRMNYYETETKLLRKNVNDQTEQIGTLQIGTQRLTRERDKIKRNFETSVVEFESHKAKCGETLKRLKNEVIGLSSKVVEKGRIAMKQKEQIDNSKSDLEVLRKILDTDANLTVNNIEKNLDANSTDIEKINLQILRDTHDKFRVEFQSHVEKLEDMLKESRTSSDTVTVVQSPMSRIKLEDIKCLRSETYELHTDVTSIKRKLAKFAVDITDMKIGLTNGEDSPHKGSDELTLEIKLSKMNELVTKIECRHHAVINKNSMLLEKTLLDDDVTAKDLVKKFQIVSLQGEIRQLKVFVGLLQKKYKFNEEELEDELKIISAGDKISMAELLSIANQITTSKELHCIEIDGNPEVVVTCPNETSLNEMYTNSQTRPNKTYNFFNQMITPDKPTTNLSTKTISTGYVSRSAYSTPTSCSDEEDIVRLPRRYHSVPRRQRRPKSSYS